MFVQPRRLFAFSRAGNDERQFLHLERLHQIIQRAQPHRLHRTGDDAIRRHHNDAGAGRKDLPFQQRRAASVREIHVQQRKIEAEVRQALPRRLQRACARHVRAERFQLRGDLLAQQRFVLDDQNIQSGEMLRRHGALMPQTSEDGDSKMCRVT